MASSVSDSAVTRRLLQQVEAGDDNAFEQLFSRHRTHLRRMVELRMDPRLRQRVDPSDLVQETHLEAARRVHRYLEQPPMSFRLWLRAIAHDRLIMMRRRHVDAGRRALAREVPLPDQTSLQLARCALAQGPSPSEVAMRGEMVRHVHEAMGRLSDIDREVLIMRMLEGLSNKDVAQQLGLQPAAVSLRLGRALIRLRKVLSENEHTE